MMEVEKHLSRKELAALIREETGPRIKDRLNFIQHLYDGGEVSEAGGCVSRVWEFETPSQEVSVDRLDANTFGFYALNGADAIEFIPNSRSESVCEFLRRVRDENPDNPLIVILDNYLSHHANEVKELADDLGIQLVFLPKSRHTSIQSNHSGES